MLVRALSDPRHVCAGCGGSCHGVVVRLASEEERARVASVAVALGVEEPIVEGALRQDHGRCVFLDGSHRCRIHATFGSAAKPGVCRQYPVVAIDAGDEVRVGVDPGCYTAWRSRVTGEPISLEGVTPLAAPVDAPEAEAALLALAAGASVSELLARLAAPGVQGRWLQRLREPSLLALLDRPETGAHVRGAVAPVLRVAGALEEPPLAPLPEALDAWAVEVTRRMLFLRLNRRLPVPAVALLTLLAATACGWHTRDPDDYCSALAGWVRALRAPPFLAALVPDEGVFRWLVTGR